MNRKQGWGPVAVATLGLAIASLAACGPGVAPTAVEGARDDLKYVPPVYKTRQVDVKQRQCRWISETNMVNGKSKSTLVHKCKDVKVGIRQETYQAKPAKWCVELDDVNDDTTADDRWYRVNRGDHQLASEMTEGSSISFVPLAEGC